MTSLKFRFATAILAVVVFTGVQGAGQQRLPDEIVVSGYRSMTTFELDNSVSVLDEQTINQSAVENFEELVHLIPNMSLSGEGSRARYFQIRGVGEREQYEGAPNPSVGYIIDDIDLSGIGGISSTFDLQQIDVLRGPQSARYGSSALAGIVYVQSAMPSDEFGATIELGGGTDDMWSVGAAVGGPLTDSLGGRMSVHYYEDNGFRDNPFLDKDDTNGREELSVRGKLSFEFADNWNALLSGLYTDYDNGYDAWSLANNDTVLSNQPGEDSQKTKAGSLKFSGPLSSAVDFVSITSAADSDIVFAYDADWANRDTFLPDYQVEYSSHNPRQRDTLSQEFRFVSGEDGRIFGDTTEWVAGIYVSRLEEDNQITNPGVYVDFDDASCPGPFPGFCVSQRDVDSEYEADTYAVFAGIESRLTEKLGLSVGLRFERWDADYNDSWVDNSYFDEDFNPIMVDGNNSFSPDENMLGGHVALSYDWSDELRGYARIARGFKAGGFNPSLAAVTDAGIVGPYGPEQISYDPEYLWNYEVGFKADWLDGTLQTDLSVFYMDRDDAQLSQSDQFGDPNAFIFVTSNGEANSYGVEFSSVWQATDSLRLHGLLGLLETEIDEWAVRPARPPASLRGEATTQLFTGRCIYRHNAPCRAAVRTVFGHWRESSHL